MHSLHLSPSYFSSLTGHNHTRFPTQDWCELKFLQAGAEMMGNAKHPPALRTGGELQSGGGTGEIMKAIQKHCNKVQCTVVLLKFKPGMNSFIC